MQPLPEYLDPTVVPRDLRSAEQLATRGYREHGAVAGWLVTPLQRTALYSTSEARRLRGYAWAWPRRDADGAAGANRGAARGSPTGSSASGSRPQPRRGVLASHTPVASRRNRRPSLRLDPDRWLVELFREGFVVIDTETTGLSGRDEIIEVAAVAMDGTLLFESLVRPKSGYVPAASTRIHGLSFGDVAEAPSWPEVMESLFPVISGHRLFAWNAVFDERMSVQSSRAWGVEHPLPGFECAMRAYTACRGVASGSLRLERAAAVEGVLLDRQSHRSAADARLTASVLRCLQRSTTARA